MNEPVAIVEVRDASITFPGVKALDGVDFRLFPGEVHALMGEMAHRSGNLAGAEQHFRVATLVVQHAQDCDRARFVCRSSPLLSGRGTPRREHPSRRPDFPGPSCGWE